MRNRRKSIKTNILTTRLTCVAFESALFVAVDWRADGYYDEESKDEIDGVPELADWGGVDADVFGEAVEDVPHGGAVAGLVLLVIDCRGNGEAGSKSAISIIYFSLFCLFFVSIHALNDHEKLGIIAYLSEFLFLSNFNQNISIRTQENQKKVRFSKYFLIKNRDHFVKSTISLSNRKMWLDWGRSRQV